MDRPDQEKFWAGQFGDNYIDRNKSETLLNSKTGIFQRILSSAGQIDSVLELGCNIGLNLKAIQKKRPKVHLYGVEINQKAVTMARKIENSKIFYNSIIGFESSVTCDLVFTAGVLIHIPEKYLTQVYQTLFNSSSKYILIYEYYNPIPVEIQYRGHKEKLFKRDFAGEILDLYPDLILKDYGFIYHRDPEFPDDDLTWFLFEKPKLNIDADF